MEKKKEVKEESEEQQPIEKAILDSKENRYKTIAHVIARARELSRHNDQHLTMHDIMSKAIDDIYMDKAAGK
jgi:hypothetical protein